MLEENRISVDFGRISYFVQKGERETILFLQNISLTKEWVTQQKLPNYSWIIPDFIGFGSSSRIKDTDAFSIAQCAKDISKIIEKEGIAELFVIGHGCGGIIALELIKHCNIQKLILIQTPLVPEDIGDDIGKKSFNEYLIDYNKEIERYTRLNTPMSKLIVRHLKKIDPFSVWSAYVAMEQFFKRKQDILSIQIPMYYLVSEPFKGVLKSEKLVKTSKFDVLYIPDAQQNPHIENPEELWKIIDEIIER